MTSENPAFNIGVLGAGQIAQAAHFVACRKARTAELYAICDAAEDLLDRMALIHQPQVTYTDYDKMLADSSIDAVIVAVADEFHVPLAIRRVRRLGSPRRCLRRPVIRLGIFAKTFARPTVEQTLQAVADAGIAAVQFNLSVLGLPIEALHGAGFGGTLVIHGLNEPDVSLAVHTLQDAMTRKQGT